MVLNRCFITGVGGFIGYHLAKRCLDSGMDVIGIDNLNTYYDINLKNSRLDILKKYQNFKFLHSDISDRKTMEDIFKNNQFDVVVNLAAQAGVRYSIENPSAYVDSNLTGFCNILEGCRHQNIKHLVFASSSSVYGANTSMPFSVHDNVDHPVSLYAATKKSNELLAHSYSHLYDMACTGLRFFTVYGPWGRPDMALFLFTKAILSGEPINIFNHGKMKRDFTYIDDIVEGVFRVIHKIPEKNVLWDGDNPDPGSSYKKYKIYNIGNNKPVELNDFISTLEDVVGKKAVKNYMDMQPGDVPATFADIESLEKEVGFKPATPLKKGIENFVTWYKTYYQI